MNAGEKTEDEKESKAEFVEKIIGQLTCPVCYETCFPPIYMCENGHGVCATCQAKLKFCSECRAPGKPTARCVQLEKIAELIQNPCENQKWGCKRSFVNEHDMSEHLAHCDHGFLCYMCPDWKGSPDALDKHVMSRHASCHVGNVSSLLPMRFWTAILADGSLHDNPYFYMLKVGADVFWMELLYTSATNVFSTTLRIVSCVESAAKRYKYSVEFRPEDETAGSKLFYEARVKLIYSTDGKMEFVLPSDITESLKDGKIWFTLKITPTKALLSQPWR